MIVVIDFVQLYLKYHLVNLILLLVVGYVAYVISLFKFDILIHQLTRSLKNIVNGDMQFRFTIVFSEVVDTRKKLFFNRFR